MTDKQIIIDGADVSGCEFCDYKGADIPPCRIRFASFEPICEGYNCYYKQLKRKEQELKDICKAFDIEYIIDKETGNLIGRCNKLYKKEQECDELKIYIKSNEQQIKEVKDERN